MPFKAVGIGEVLWDLLPDGKQLGGAPGNFAAHARALGADAALISRVGDDELGRELRKALAVLGLPTECIEIDAQRATGTVSVELAGDGQPQFQIHENVAWDALRGEDAGRRAVSSADAVCFGTLAQRSERSRKTIRSLIAGAPARALCIFDINLRQNYYSASLIEESLALANVLKVNDSELERLAELFSLRGDMRSQIQQLAERHALRLVACTRGSRGSLLFSGGRWSNHSGEETRVADTIGAGDSLTAAITLGFLKGWDLDRINAQANRIAAYVCSQAGATPPLPEALRQPFLNDV